MASSSGISRVVAVLLVGASALAVPSIVSHRLLPQDSGRKPSAATVAGDPAVEDQAPADVAVDTGGLQADSDPATELPRAADIAVGEQIAKKCIACHSFDKNGSNKVGPNLWGIVDRQPAAVAGFSYSDALKSRSEAWSFEALNDFLAAPKDNLPGTKMTFPGIKKADERAALLAFLGTLSVSPKQLPDTLQSVTPPEPAAPADDPSAPTDTSQAAGDPQDQNAAVSTPLGAPTPEAPSVSASSVPTTGPAARTLAGWLAVADLKLGEKINRQCAVCHSFEQGGAKKIGPNLWDIVGAKQAAKADFPYSGAFKALSGDWSFEELDKFLAAPQDYAPGTKMNFPGLNRPADRAAVIVWLRNQSPSPRLLPQASPEEAASIAASTSESPALSQSEPQLPTATESPQAPAPMTDQGAAVETEVNAGPTGTQQALIPAPSALEELLKTADVAAGEKAGKKCLACHSFDKGGPAKIGPNLWDIVGAKQASVEEYKYSDALKSLAGEWSYEELDRFLSAPKEYVGGTKMAFPGLKSAEERAAVIAWLRTLSDSPRPLP